MSSTKATSRQKQTQTLKQTQRSNDSRILQMLEQIKLLIKPPPPPSAKYSSSKITVSGLPNSGLITNLISAFSGLFIFLVAPYVVNKIGNTTLAALVNVFPTGVLICLFIKEDEFGYFYHKLLFAPIFNIVVNWIVYMFYFYFKWSPVATITLNLSIWFAACVLAYLFF